MEITPEQLAELDKLLKAAEIKWNLNLGFMCYEDIQQIIRIHIARKINLFDPERGKFSTWAKRVINNQILNQKKKNFLRYLLPCEDCPNAGCGRGPNSKSKTCPIQDKWSKNKIQANNIHFAASLDESFEGEEAAKIQVAGTLVNLEAAAEKFHAMMLDALEDRVREFYQLKYIDGKTEREIAKIFGFSTSETNRCPGYRQIHNYLTQIREIADFIITHKDIF